MINPRNLRAFVAVARHGSVARAGEHIHRVQSAITRSVQELEAGLRVPLFERRPHGMLATEFGQLLLLHAESALRELEAARRAIAALVEGARWNPNAPVFGLGLGRQRLLVFVDLMRQRHMGAVAQRFGISQSAVSQALREVEQGLGLPLMQRLPQGLAPNPAGERLALHLRRALAALSQAEEAIAARLQGITGHVVVGTLSLGRNRLLPQGIVRVMQAHPAITVATIEGSFEHLATLLRAAEIDFILGGLRPGGPMAGLVARPLASAGIALVARRGHPLAAGLGDDPWAALDHARWVLPELGTWTRQALELALARRRRPPPEVAVQTADLTIMRALLQGSDLVTAAAPHLFADELEAGTLVVLPLELSAETRDIGFVLRAGASPSVAARLLMDAIASTPTL